MFRVHSLSVLLSIILGATACNAQTIKYAGAVEFVEMKQDKFRRTDPQLVMYTRELNTDVLKLARLIDNKAARHPEIKCLVVVTHENDPTPSQQEWDDQFASLKNTIDQNRMKDLSFALWRRFPQEYKKKGSKRAAFRYGKFGDGDIAIELTRKRSDSKTDVMRQYLEVLKSQELNNDTIESISRQLDRLFSVT